MTVTLILEPASGTGGVVLVCLPERVAARVDIKSLAVNRAHMYKTELTRHTFGKGSVGLCPIIVLSAHGTLANNPVILLKLHPVPAAVLDKGSKLNQRSRVSLIPVFIVKSHQSQAWIRLNGLGTGYVCVQRKEK